MGGRAGREVRGVRRRRDERGVEPGDQDPEVLGEVGRGIEVRRLRGGNQRREPLRGGLVRVGGVRDERLEHRDRRGPGVPRHDLGPAGQPRHARERRLLGQERGQLEVGVEARLDPAIGLEQQRVADHHRRVGLVAPQRPLDGGRDRAASPGVPQRREAGRGAAHEGGGRPGRRIVVAGHRGDRAALGDRGRQRPPGAIAFDGLAQASSIARGRERDRVAVGPVAAVARPAAGEVDQREHGRRGQRERVGEPCLGRDRALGREPATPGERLEVERADGRGHGLEAGRHRGRDGHRSRRAGAVRVAPERSIRSPC